MSPRVTPSPDWIIFFDGECHLCNWSIDWVVKRQQAGRLGRRVWIASLQGNQAKQLLSAEVIQNRESVILWDQNGPLLTRSDAVIALLSRVSGYRMVSWLMGAIPRFLRDASYQWVAANRFKWFGKRDLCRIPSIEERSYFLD